MAFGLTHGVAAFAARPCGGNGGQQQGFVADILGFMFGYVDAHKLAMAAITAA